MINELFLENKKTEAKLEETNEELNKTKDRLKKLEDDFNKYFLNLKNENATFENEINENDSGGVTTFENTHKLIKNEKRENETL